MSDREPDEPTNAVKAACYTAEKAAAKKGVVLVDQMSAGGKRVIGRTNEKNKGLARIGRRWCGTLGLRSGISMSGGRRSWALSSRFIQAARRRIMAQTMEGRRRGLRRDWSEVLNLHNRVNVGTLVTVDV